MTTIQHSRRSLGDGGGAADHLRRLPGLRALFGYKAGWLPCDLVPVLVVTALLVPAEVH
jgi:sulfite exporter TauE/SafE